MSLRTAADLRTVCEVLREINDELQGNPKHPVVLPKLIEAEKMCKKMAKKLYQYNKEFDKGWWEKNPETAERLERRLNENYIS